MNEENTMTFNAGTMIVKFKKQNGEIRTLVGTLFPPTFVGNYKETLEVINNSTDCLITMFDYEANNWRSFYKRNIIELEDA
jgi:hypothetical protein